MSHLLPCPSCNRHVFNDEANCPFCKQPLPTEMATREQGPLPRGRLGRAALLVFSTVGATACGASTEAATDMMGGSSAGGSSNAMNGGGAGGSSNMNSGAGMSSGGTPEMPVQPVYGAAVLPPENGGAASGGAPAMEGGGDGGFATVPAYGVAPVDPIEGAGGQGAGGAGAGGEAVGGSSTGGASVEDPGPVLPLYGVAPVEPENTD